MLLYVRHDRVCRLSSALVAALRNAHVSYYVCKALTHAPQTCKFVLFFACRPSDDAIRAGRYEEKFRTTFIAPDETSTGMAFDSDLKVHASKNSELHFICKHCCMEIAAFAA